MISHLQAIKEKTQQVRPTFLFRAPGTTTTPAQFVILQAPGWGSPDELPVCGDSAELSVEIRVLVRALTGEAVAIILAELHNVLAPRQIPTPLAVAGRHALLTWQRSEFLAADLDVIAPETNTHPFFGVDSYHLVSQTTGELDA